MRRRWQGMEWVDRFGYGVMVGFALAIVVLTACSMVVEEPAPTLPAMPLPSYVSSTTMVATVTTFCGHAGVPYNECGGPVLPHIPTDAVRVATGP